MDALLYLPNSFSLDDDSEDEEQCNHHQNEHFESLNTTFRPELEQIINTNASDTTKKIFEDLNDNTILTDDEDTTEPTDDGNTNEPTDDGNNSEENQQQLSIPETLRQQSSTCRNTSFASCFRCSKSERITMGHSIEPGMHIKFGKYFMSAKVDSFVSKCFMRFGFNHRHIYYHHAIVLEVHETSDMEARVTLLELTKNEQQKFEVLKKDRTIDLRKKKTFRVKYNHSKWTQEQIIERANKCIGQSGYDALNFNCEHIAIWCVSGQHESFMSSDGTDSWLRHRLSWVMSLLGKLIQVLNKVEGTHIVKFCRFVLGSFIFSLTFFFIEFAFSCVRLYEIRKQKQSGLICKKCYNEKKVFLISQVMLSAVAVTALLVIHHSSTVLFWLVGTVCMVVGVAALPHLIAFLHKKCWSMVNPLYQIPTSVVRTCTDINKGDVLVIHNDHSVIVKDVHTIPRVGPWHILHLDIVHFRQRGFLGKRTVERENFRINLQETYCKVMIFQKDCVFGDNEVVQNAIRKVGEDGHSMFSNRSSHMSRKCKIKPDKLHDIGDPTIEVAKTDKDVKEGDMVKFSFRNFPHQGIVVEKYRPADIIEITCYHVKDGEVKEDVFQLDLEDENVLIYDIVQQIKRPDEILYHASSQLGERVYSWRPYKSSRFAKECLLKEDK